MLVLADDWLTYLSAENKARVKSTCRREETNLFEFKFKNSLLDFDHYWNIPTSSIEIEKPFVSLSTLAMELKLMLPFRPNDKLFYKWTFPITYHQHLSFINTSKRAMISFSAPQHLDTSIPRYLDTRKKKLENVQYGIGHQYLVYNEDMNIQLWSKILKKQLVGNL